MQYVCSLTLQTDSSYTTDNKSKMQKRQQQITVSLCRGAEDVELWFTEVENLLALEDVGKVCYPDAIRRKV